MKFYECRFAPNASTWRDAIRVAQLVRHDGQSVYEAFTPEAFAGWGAADIAILLDHDVKKRAGTVTAIAAHRDWWHASFVLDGPHAARAAEYIERSGLVSPGFNDHAKDADLAEPITPAHYPTHLYTSAKLNEISVVRPGAIAWYQGAKVTRAYESKETPTEKPKPKPATNTRRPSIVATAPLARRHIRPQDETLELHAA